MADSEPSSPLSMSPDEFREFGHRVIDLIADYRAGVAARPVTSDIRPGALLAQLPTSPPEAPQGFERVLRDVEELVLPALRHWQHPEFFAYFPSNGDLAAVLGDLLSTGLGVLGLTWESAPALTELEDRSVDWLRQLSGLSSAWQGVIQDTASTCTMIALVTARERATGLGFTDRGMQHGGAPLVVYASEQAHSSVQKAAMLAGFGLEHVRTIATGADYAIDVDALGAALAHDVQQGLRPCAIVATTGTTTSTAMDPIAAVAELARQHGAWLHVDAAMAGSAMILPECRHLWHGIEGADSLVLNPHKWLGVSFDCSVFYVRDDQHLVRVMRTDPSYLRTEFDDRVKTYRDWGIALGRRFRALKLWSLLQTHGAARLRARLRRDLDNARWLRQQLEASPPWRVLAPAPLQTLCVRHEPDGVHGEALDEHTLRWLERLQATGHAWLTPARLDDRWMVRISIGALTTERGHVEALWRRLQDAVRA